MKELRKQLRDLKHIEGLVNPDRVWVSENKARLMERITAEVADEQVNRGRWFLCKQAIKTFVPGSVLAYARPAFTAMMVLIVAIAGWAASVSASFNSLPGDVLWNVKVAAEKTQIVFSSKEEKIKKKLEFAERRVEEVKMVLELEDTEKKTEKRVEAAKREIQKVQKSIKEVVDDTEKTVKDTIKKDPTKAVELALAVEGKTDDIAKDLDELVEVAVEEGGDEEFVKDVVDAAEGTNESAFESAKSVVEVSAEIDVSDNQEVQEELKQIVKEVVAEKLEDVIEDAEEVRQKVEIGKEVEKEVETTDEVTAEAVSSTEAVEVDEDQLVSSTTQEIDVDAQTNSDTSDTKEMEVVEFSEEVKQEVEEKTRTVEESSEEVRDLIEEGKLDEALNKIIDLDQINGDAEEIINEEIRSEGEEMKKETEDGVTLGETDVLAEITEQT